MGYNKEIINIIKNSSTIKERYCQGFAPTNTGGNKKVIASRRAAWKESVSHGEPGPFELYLQNEGLNYGKCCLLLGEVELPDNYAFPRWAEILEEILMTYKSFKTSEKAYINKFSNYLGSKQCIAFQELFMPIVKLAHIHMDKILKDQIHHVSKNALYSLEYNLLEQLSATASKVLEAEFSIYRSMHQMSLDRLLYGASSYKLYTSYVELMLEGEFINLLLEYPVLGRLLATLVLQWLAAAIELISRVESDYKIISSVFYEGRNPGNVDEITSGLSDRHNGGRTVAIFKFGCGLKVVYKPRSLCLEEAWFDLLSRLNNEMTDNLFKIIKILDMQDYGWMEYVEHLPCTDEKDIRLYYRRAGMLLSMVHFLRGIDCHHENLIACGPYPVLVDLETLFHPYSKKLLKNEGEEENMEMYYSVLRTGLLPEPHFIKGSENVDLSGFGAGTDKAAYPVSLRWLDINTDNMRQEYVRKQVILPANLPYIENNSIPATNYVDEIVKGFEKHSNLICRYSVELLSPFSNLYEYKNMHSRFVLRPTKYYISILNKSIEPRYMKNGLERSIFLEGLYNQKSKINDLQCFTTVHETEIRSMEALNIPYFQLDIHDTSIIYSTRILIKNCFSSSGVCTVKKYLANTDITSIKSQIDYIKSSFR